TVKELENKVNQEHSNIEINEIDNSATEQIEKLQNVIEDLKKNYQESKDENNRIIDDGEKKLQELESEEDVGLLLTNHFRFSDERAMAIPEKQE
ncbi:14789_t:CDS:2, partial [Entrophospora sp. SA101]